MRWGWLCLLLLACEGSPSKREARPSTQSTQPADAAGLLDQPAQAAAEHAALREAEPRAQPVHIAGDGGVLEPGAPLALAAGEQKTLDLPNGARLIAYGPLLARLAMPTRERPQYGMWLRRGVLSVDLAPAAATPSSGLWLATPAARLELVRSGRLALRVLESGATVLRTVSGSATLIAATLPVEQQKLQLSPGQEVTVQVAAPMQRRAPAGKTLESVTQELRAWRAGSQPLTLAPLEQAARAAQAVTETERARLVEAQARHRESLSGSAEQRMAAQGRVAQAASALAQRAAHQRALADQLAAARLQAGPLPAAAGE